MRSSGMYWLLCGASGLVWSLIHPALGGLLHAPFQPRMILAGALVGLVVGVIARPWIKAQFPVLIYGSLFNLYVAGALFGFLSMLDEWLSGRVPRGTTFAQALDLSWQCAVRTDVAMTLSMAVVVLWPLAFLNHFVIGRWD